MWPVENIRDYGTREAAPGQAGQLLRSWPEHVSACNDVSYAFGAFTIDLLLEVVSTHDSAVKSVADATLLPIYTSAFLPAPDAAGVQNTAVF